MIAIAILGLVVPGYLVARALRSPVTWEIAFPMSALLLAVIVIAYALLGIPIRFGYVLSADVLVSLISFVAWFRRKPEGGARLVNRANRTLQNPSRVFVVLCAVLIGLVLLGLALRTALYPLSGPDTVFRWDVLPRLMVEQQNLSYYPPVTAEDFQKYTWPESFPPLAVTCYWWLYAAWGSACPRMTSVVIFLQTASCFAIVFHAARSLFGSAGGVLALIVLSSSAFFLHGLAIGQENGYTALSYAGQLLFAFAAIREPRASLIVLAGLFGGLGALSREYGPLLLLSGFAVLACHRETRRYLPLFCLVSAIIGVPWYIRNWVFTGNPVYSLDVGLGFPVNTVFAGILAAYHKYLKWDSYPAAVWLEAGKELLIGAPLALVVGVPGLVAAGRNGIALGISVGASFFLWFLSIPHTSGGMVYTWRVLTPAWVALSIAAGAFGFVLVRATKRWKRLIQAGGALLVVICGVYAVLCCWSQPFTPSEIKNAVFNTRKDPLESYRVQLALAQKLEESNLPAVGVLTDDNSLAIALQRNTRFRPVLIYSPEVAFVFNPYFNADDAMRRLVEKGIRLVSISPHSFNNDYLFKFPFYRDGTKNWLLILNAPDAEAIFLLPKQSEPGADRSATP